MEDKLLKLLYEGGAIREDQYQQVMDDLQDSGGRPQRALQQSGILTEEQIVDFLSKEFRMPVINWDEYTPDPELLELVSETLAMKYMVFPFALERAKRGGKITLAVTNPWDVSAIDDIAFGTGCTVRAAVSSERDIRQAIQQYYGVQAFDNEVSQGEGRQKASAPLERFPATRIDEFDSVLTTLLQSIDVTDEIVDNLSGLDVEHPASKLLLELLDIAMKRGASEIHLEPFEQEYRVRFRIHGVLQPHTTIPDHVGREIAIRLRRLMQRPEMPSALRKESQSSWNGSLQIERVRGRSLTVLISFYPTLYGDKILLKPTPVSAVKSLGQLGLTESSVKTLQRIQAKSEGLLLVIAPAGHGKISTLYALVKQYEQAGMDGLMIESPVHVMMPGITQISGYTPLSSYVWQSLVSYVNPDVLVVSDVEDAHIAKIAFDSASATQVIASYTASDALTGFRAFASLIETSFDAAPQDLLPVLLEEINGFVVQRLIRTLCQHCKEEVTRDEQDQRLLQWISAASGEEGDFPVYRGKGCQECMDSGYQGQIGLFEIVRCDKHVRQVLLQQPSISSAQWNQMLVEMSIPTIMQQGVQAIRDGLTSPEELWRALSK